MIFLTINVNINKYNQEIQNKTFYCEFKSQFKVLLKQYLGLRCKHNILKIAVYVSLMAIQPYKACRQSHTTKSGPMYKC